MRPFKLSDSRNPKPDSQFSVEIRNDSLTILYPGTTKLLYHDSLTEEKEKPTRLI